MTALENPGWLELIFFLSGTKTRRGSISNIRPNATDQDLYNIGVALAKLIDDILSDIMHISTTAFAA